MITDDHTQWLPTITHNDYRRPHTVITDGHTQWPLTITHNDYRWSHIMMADVHTQWLPMITHNDYNWCSHIMITGGHTQWLPAVTHNDYRQAHTMITNGHTLWLPAVKQSPHNYRWSHTMIITHNDYRRSHASHTITDGYTQWLSMVHTQSLLMITRSCCMQPHPHNDHRRSYARVACRLAWRQICALNYLKNGYRHFQTNALNPPPPFITKWMWMVFLKSQCCILRLLPRPLIRCETFRGNGNNVTITSWRNCWTLFYYHRLLALS